ncbi:Hypothetical predicted protein [Cloeon dipterum]|uniref:C-type lectin domain-containing protein n=1 Tax=Cloeon dipterum TaxID=197152 RepID=A0A8S1D9J8_9INSE|nr:Hypothetical predicted protein [Cloeon dipterum]
MPGLKRDAERHDREQSHSSPADHPAHFSFHRSGDKLFGNVNFVNPNCTINFNFYRNVNINVDLNINVKFYTNVNVDLNFYVNINFNHDYNCKTNFNIHINFNLNFHDGINYNNYNNHYYNNRNYNYNHSNDNYCVVPSRQLYRQSLWNEVNTFNTVSPLGVKLTFGYVIILCNKKYVHSDTAANLATAYSNCCQYGMKLASFSDQSQVDCLKNHFSAGPTWVAASITGSIVNPRWCTENSSFYLKDFTAANPTLPGPGYDAISMDISTGTFSYAKSTDLFSWTLCVV